MILNTVSAGGGALFGLPTYTYTGNAQLIDDGKANGKQNWRIKFLTSGTLVFKNNPGAIDVFLVGGGGGGGYDSGGGGGGGYTITSIIPTITKDTSYTITVGAGGAGVSSSATNGLAGGESSAFGLSVAGGKGGYSYRESYRSGGIGGSGGGGGSAGGSGAGGIDGGDGKPGPYYAEGAIGSGGKGQGTTTREFGESDGKLYATGGPGNNISAGDGSANSGDGGGGSEGRSRSRSGGSGIVVIRNKR